MPQFVQEYKTVSPSKLADIILRRRNAKKTSESVTMWFKSHREIYAQLSKTLSEKLPTEKEALDESIFERSNFRELSSIKKWIEVLQGREVTVGYIMDKLINLKNLCRGTIHGHDLVAEGMWSLKHPDRLCFDDLLEINAVLKGLGFDTCHYKRDLKDFLENVRDIPVGKKITVGKPRGFGKYASLFLEKGKIASILRWVKSVDFEPYVIDRFMFKTGTRITATLEARIENLTMVGSSAALRVYDKGRISKYPQGHPWDKYIDASLLSEIRQIINQRKYGKIFSVAHNEMQRLNFQAIKKFAPELFLVYPDLRKANHFWRHMFFQHMLRATDWNYEVCAELGGSTVASVQESYGRPPEATVQIWGLKYIPTLDVCQEKIAAEIVREGRN